MTICKQCKGYVPDLGDPHNCTKYGMYQPYPSVCPPIQPQPIRGQKCGQCGSTAIDHTENQCLINRQMKPLAQQSSDHDPLGGSTTGEKDD